MSSDLYSRPVMLVDRYELREVVGRGGMGEVWAARDTRLDRDVAVKMLNAQMASEAGVRDRFETEARSAARLNHPNVVAVYDSGEHDGVPFLVMELLPGRTLSDELQEGPLDIARARLIGAQVLAAIGASHAAGILHRDIKPGNVLLTAEGNAKVSDFGIAKSTEGLNLTSVGMIVGTASYLAPERVAGQPASAQSDLYAVGVVLYETLAGRKPFDADTPIGMLRAVESGAPPPLSELRPGLDPVLVACIERAMDKDPDRRFRTAEEMATSVADMASTSKVEAMDAAASTDATAAFSSTQVLPLPPPQPALEAASPAVGMHRRPWVRDKVAIATAVVAILLFGLILLFTTSNSSSKGSGTSVPTTGAPAAGTGLASELDDAISRLEQAVRP